MPKAVKAVDDGPEGEGQQHEIEALRPYIAHGIYFDRDFKDESVGNCPWCDKQKFHVNKENGKWKCFTCGKGGNAILFLRELADTWGGIGDYDTLAHNRGISPDVLKRWGVFWSPLVDQWMVPGFSTKGRQISQLYRYVRLGDKMKLLPTPTLDHQLFGLNLYDDEKETCYIGEGPWDGAKLGEALLTHLQDENGKILPAPNEQMSMANMVNVLATPGSNVFYDRWLPLFKKKTVILMFDNDHPVTNKQTGSVREGAGLMGVKRIATMMWASQSYKPTAIYYLNWGKEGYDPNIKNGADTRDILLGKV